MIKLVITDLDDTLYSWIGFFIPAFYDMVQELSLLINVPQEKLLEEYKAIHQEVGSVEYPFATLNLPSVKKKYCGYGMSYFMVFGPYYRGGCSYGRSPTNCRTNTY